MNLTEMNIRSLPAKIARRLLWMAEDIEEGSVSRLRRRFPDCYETVRALARLQPGNLKTVYDIGARNGNWIRTFNAFFPSLIDVVLFEPEQSCQSDLARLSLEDVSVRVVDVALGKAEGTAVLNGSGASASLMECTHYQEDLYPGSTKGNTSEVKVDSLDHWCSESGAGPPDLVKIDVQGAELDVLLGAEKVLSTCRWLVIELSTLTLYNGQSLSGRIVEWLEAHGWRLVGFGYRWTSPKGQLLQFDAVFTREGVI